MSVFQNMNQFGQTPLKGNVSAIVNPDTISVRVDPNSTNTLVPGDVVVLTTTSGNEILVDKASATQIGFGFVIYQVKKDKFVANDLMEIALGGTIMWVEASGTVTRNQFVEYVSSTSTVIASAGTNPICGLALDSTTTGNLFRIITRFASINSTLSSSVVLLGMPAAQVTGINPNQGSVFVLTPTVGGTITANLVNAGQKISFIIHTSGTNAFSLTFGTNFKPTGVFGTGTVDGKNIGVDFVSDGTNYVQTGPSSGLI